MIRLIRKLFRKRRGPASLTRADIQREWLKHNMMPEYKWQWPKKGER